MGGKHKDWRLRVRDLKKDKSRLLPESYDSETGALRGAAARTSLYGTTLSASEKIYVVRPDKSSYWYRPGRPGLAKTKPVAKSSGAQERLQARRQRIEATQKTSDALLAWKKDKDEEIAGRKKRGKKDPYPTSFLSPIDRRLYAAVDRMIKLAETA